MEALAILTEQQINQKLTRMAYRIWETNSDAKELYFYGIVEVGHVLATKLAALVTNISGIKVHLHSISLDKKGPLNSDVNLSAVPPNGKTIVLIDDVANSGKTLVHAIKPLLNCNPKKIQVAVLVDRKHKSFPVMPDIIGHTLSTTLQENIFVDTEGERLTGVHLA